MALVQCPHCGQPVSDKAKSCPHCGKDPQAPVSSVKEEKVEVEVKNTPDTATPPAKQKKNSSLIAWLIVAGLFLIAGGVAFWFYRNNIYLPAKRDAEAPRYYVMSQNLNMRSTPEFEADYNKIGTFPYGTEMIIYDSVKLGLNPYLYGKYAPTDARGKVIKDKVVEGYMSYKFMLNKADFFLLNSIFGNDDARKMLSEARYRRALLSYFKSKHYRGDINTTKMSECGIDSKYHTAERWQVFCRHEKAKSNNVYRSKKYRKDSKYSDVAIIIQNIDTKERRLLYYFFDDDETFHLLFEQPVPSNGYMKDRTLKLKQNDYGSYYVEVEYDDEY